MAAGRNMPQACRADKLVYIVAMKKILLLLVLLVVAIGVGTGCKSSHSGSREFAPGKGWQHTD
jgi:hypothetical protein